MLLWLMPAWILFSPRITSAIISMIAAADYFISLHFAISLLFRAPLAYCYWCRWLRFITLRFLDFCRCRFLFYADYFALRLFHLFSLLYFILCWCHIFAASLMLCRDAMMFRYYAQLPCRAHAVTQRRFSLRADDTIAFLHDMRSCALRCWWKRRHAMALICCCFNRSAAPPARCWSLTPGATRRPRYSMSAAMP